MLLPLILPQLQIKVNLKGNYKLERFIVNKKADRATAFEKRNSTYGKVIA